MGLVGVVVLTLVFGGVLLVLANELAVAKAAPPRVVYRYLPRDIDTYTRSQESLSQVTLKNLFDGEDPTMR